MLFVLQALISPHIHQADGSSRHAATASARADATVDVAPICNSGSGQQQNPCNHVDCAICSNQTERHAALFLVAAANTILLPPEQRRLDTPPFAHTTLPDEAIDIAAGAPRAPPTFS